MEEMKDDVVCQWHNHSALLAVGLLPSAENKFSQHQDCERISMSITKLKLQSTCPFVLYGINVTKTASA